VEASNASGRSGGPLPAHLPRERVVHLAPTVCPCCRGSALRKISEDVIEMLEHVPASWKVIQHAREVPVSLGTASCDGIAASWRLVFFGDYSADAANWRRTSVAEMALSEASRSMCATT